ncbi:pentapeptide repeat-containing protein [Paenibacillus polymyxa]|uniref:pentapeptide repeat-containing protein n=1 Tax=Paenibacillus polymyxa TaxID=1406 RepID=UPI002AB4BDC6|nr:pentapeptide repeat-containing protein [Paenibacillus polymyxa]MDY7991368.1 pentapeptide repeat-containing protein [Paenibacillus polymyxa]MDY8117808.1 pentapeptide repeat-containing protein [Paenibacillus polymyxa]
MNREEVFRHFKNEIYEPLKHRMLFALEVYFQNHKHALAKAFCNSLEQIFEKVKLMQQEGNKQALGYISYSMLRTELANGRATYLVEAMDKRWFMDLHTCRDTYNADWAFHYLHEWETELSKHAKKYGGRIGLDDIERMKLRAAIHIHQYIIALARFSITEAWLDEIQFAHEIQLEDVFEMRVGEYWDQSEVVFKRDVRVKDSNVIKDWLEEKKPYDYIHEVFRKIDGSQGNYEGIRLQYADLNESSFINSVFTKGNLIGSRWNKACLIEADFSGCLIQEARFEKANLREASFRDAVAVPGIYQSERWERPGFQPVSFAGADLTGATFQGAYLQDADFTGAILQGANFIGAAIEGACFKGAVLDRTGFSLGMHPVARDLTSFG